MSEVLTPKELAHQEAKLVDLLLDRECSKLYAHSFAAVFDRSASSMGAQKISGGEDEWAMYDFVTGDVREKLVAAMTGIAEAVDSCSKELVRAKVAMERLGKLRVAKWDEIETERAEQKAKRRRGRVRQAPESARRPA